MGEGQFLAAIQRRHQRLLGEVGTPLGVFALHAEGLDEEVPRGVGAAGDRVLLVELEHAPIFELGVQHHQPMPGQFEVQEVRLVPLGEEAGLEGQLAQRADPVLQGEAGGAGLVLLGEDLPGVEADGATHRAAVGADEIGVAEGPPRGGFAVVKDLELEHAAGSPFRPARL